jgi:hypothetical protein
MSDPEPLLHGESTAFERQLLDAAARERPSAEMLGSMQQTLGIGTSTVKAGVSAGSSLAAYTAVAVLAVGGALIGLVSLRDPAPSTAPAASVQRALPAQRPQLPAAVPGPIPSPVALAAPAVGRRNEPAPVVQAPPSRATTSDDLRAEIRLVDEARAALRSGATERAAALLERYGQRFPRGAFRQEVAVLRVEALERQGERRRASALAREFLEQHPDSPHSERVGRVLAAPAK